MSKAKPLICDHCRRVVVEGPYSKWVGRNGTTCPENRAGHEVLGRGHA